MTISKAALLRLGRQVAAWAFWPAVAVVVWGELTPHPPALEGPWAWDKMDHFTAYFGLALMASLVCGLRRRLAWVFLGVLGLGGALEILQAFVGRDAEWSDMAANTLGAVLGLGLALMLLAWAAPLVDALRRD